MADKLTPEVLWAQRSSSTDPEKNFIYLTISVPDVPSSNIKLNLQPTGLTFEGHSDTLKRDYHLDLTFFGEIDVEHSKTNHTSRNVEMKLRKKELKEEYWPRLLKDAKKVQFLKTDFDKWVDEDEQDEAPEEDQFGGAGGMGGGGDFGGIDFSKLGAGGLGGMPDMAGMGGLGDMPEDDDEDDDEDMPALEGDDEAKGEAKGEEAKGEEAKGEEAKGEEAKGEEAKIDKKAETKTEA